jgi:23S rRNA (guanosine2251-2'-O)-methyltransferase
MAPGARHQGVIATVDATQRHVTLDDVLDTLDEPAFPARPRRHSGSAQPRRLPARRRRRRRARGRRAQGSRRRPDAGGREGRQRRCRDGPLHHGHQSRAHPARNEGTGNLDHRHRCRAPRTISTAAQWPTACAWVLGAEGDGLRRLTRETCDQLVNIPMLGSVASLNVSVATGVCLYEARRRRAPSANCSNSGNNS